MAADTQNAIEDLRRILDQVTEEKSSGQVSQATAASVRKALLKLRRAHAKLRESQSHSTREALGAVEQFKRARLLMENSRFVESQCRFLAEKYESTQTPELDKVSLFLPSVDEFTRLHSGETDFVSYEADPHQFMLAMLSNELIERKKLEESIESLETTRDTLQAQITKKQKFLTSMSSELKELTKSIGSINALFSSPSETFSAPSTTVAPIPFADELTLTPQLFTIAGKFWSILTPSCVQVDTVGDAKELIVLVPPLAATPRPPTGASLDVQLKFMQVQSESPVTLSVSPQGIYPNLLEDVMDASVPIDTVVTNIRGAVAHLMWTAYEVASFSSRKFPIIQGSRWDADQATFTGVSITAFEHSAGGSFRIKVKTGTQETELTINLHDKSLVIQRDVVVEGRNVTMASRVTDNGGDAPVVVDISLATAEEEITEWWRSQSVGLGRYAFGELTAIVSKCISSI